MPVASPGEFMAEVISLGGEPEGARARSAGGLYLPRRSSAWISRALFAKAADGAGGGVLPEGTLE